MKSRAIKRDRIRIATLPIIVSILAKYIIENLCEKYSFVISSKEGLSNVEMMLGIWGTLLGFLITAVSILLVLNDGVFINMLKKTGHYKTVLFTYIVCCVHLFVAIIVAIVWVFLKIWSMIIFAVLCALVIDTMILVAICLFFLFVLISRIND